jgi:putative transposase
VSEFRRNYVAGETYFFTHVTEGRRPILCEPVVRNSLRRAFFKVNHKFPFKTHAIVLLPEHFHCLWTLPETDHDYSLRWRLIKTFVTKEAAGNYGSFFNSGPPKIWQPRYWEHTIRDEEDYDGHFHYIHYNPVKHGLVDAPIHWQFSTFRKYVSEGIYREDWGSGDQLIFPDGIGGE